MGRPKGPVDLGRSRAGPGAGYFGAITKEVWDILIYAWDGPFYISSNVARENPIPIAFAASLGWLSNISPDGMSFSRKWHLTAEGLHALRSRAEKHQGTP